MRPLSHDPAPSRLVYRLQRIWLTPSYRKALRQGLPVFFGVLLLLSLFGNAERRAEMGVWVQDVRASVVNRPEFAVTEIAIDGADKAVQDAIIELFPHELPVSSFDVNVAEFKETVEAIDAIVRAKLRVSPGGVLKVDVETRTPALAWYQADKVVLLDAEGNPVSPFSGELPRNIVPVAGIGADQATAEALALRQAAGPLAAQIKGFIRIGERRWDVVLADDKRILLPAEDAATAFAYFVSLNEQRDLLARHISHIDMRILDQITVRLIEDEGNGEDGEG